MCERMFDTQPDHSNYQLPLLCTNKIRALLECGSMLKRFIGLSGLSLFGCLKDKTRTPVSSAPYWSAWLPKHDNNSVLQHSLASFAAQL
jgi:hypothetical protein